MNIKEKIAAIKLDPKSLPAFVKKHCKKYHIAEGTEWYTIYAKSDFFITDCRGERFRIKKGTFGGYIDYNTWNSLDLVKVGPDFSSFWIDQSVVISESSFGLDSSLIVYAFEENSIVRANIHDARFEAFSEVYIAEDCLTKYYNENSKDILYTYAKVTDVLFGEFTKFASGTNKLTLRKSHLENGAAMTILNNFGFTLDEKVDEDVQAITKYISDRVIYLPNVIIQKTTITGNVSVETSPIVVDHEKSEQLGDKFTNMLTIFRSKIIGPVSNFGHYQISKFNVKPENVDTIEKLKNFSYMTILDSILGTTKCLECGSEFISNSNIIQSVLIDTKVKDAVFDNHDVFNCFLENCTIDKCVVNSRHCNVSEDSPTIDSFQAVDGSIDDVEFVESASMCVGKNEDFCHIIDSKTIIKECKPLIDIVNKYVDGDIEVGTLGPRLFDKILGDSDVNDLIAHRVKILLSKSCVEKLQKEKKEKEEKKIDDCHCNDLVYVANGEPWAKPSVTVTRNWDDDEEDKECECKENCKCSCSECNEDSEEEVDRWLDDPDFDDNEFMNSPYVLWNESTIASMHPSIETNSSNVHQDSYSETKNRLNEYSKFKKEHGFDPSESWNLYKHMAQFIYPRLVYFKNKNILLNPFGETEEESNENLNKMIFAMRVLALGDSDDEEIFWTRIKEGCELIGKYFLKFCW